MSLLPSDIEPPAAPALHAEPSASSGPEPGAPRLPVTPKGLPLLGHLLMLRDLLGSAERARTLGDIVKLRIPPHDLFILNRPQDIEQLLVKDHERFQKDWTTRLLKEILGQGLLVNEGDSWRRQRRIVQPELTPRRTDSYVSSMVECVERALPRFLLRGESEPTLNLHEEMMRLMLDVVGRTLFGSGTDQLASELGEIIDQYLVHFMGFFGTTLRFPDWVPSPSNLKARRNLLRLRELVGELIETRRAEARGDQASPSNDLLTRMISARDEQGNPMPDGLLCDEAVTMLLAGHETTALLLTFAVMLVAQHPDVERTLLAELRVNIAGSGPSAPELTKLPYLDAVLRETLRLYPPAYAIGREALVDTEIGGCAIPRGAQVWMYQWSVQRDPRLYREPESFRPERWLSPETADLPRFAYFPFGGGPRICPGAHFALVEAKVVLAILLPRFSFEPLRSDAPRLTPSITVRPKGGMPARVRRRN